MTIIPARSLLVDDAAAQKCFLVDWSCELQHGHPYISAMVSNGSHHYDHDMDGTHTSLSGCQANIRGQTHDTFVALRYERDTLMVTVFCVFVWLILL